MPGKSQAYSDAVLNVLPGAGITGAALYLGLFSVAPGDDASAGTELSGGGYSAPFVVDYKMSHFCQAPKRVSTND